MNKELFKTLLNSRVVILDGATGSNLMDKGMPVGVCPEEWIINNPKALIDLQREYIKAGSNIILAPTFTANRIKLSEYGLENDIEEIINKLVGFSKEAIALEGHRGYVAGDMTMTGKQLYPIGDMQFEELVEVYKEQAKYLYEAGVDLFVIETMMSLAETRACVLAIKETCDLPIMASLTFNEDGKTLFGSTPEAVAVVLQSLGVDAVGINCSTGPMEMIPLIKQMIKYADIPVFAKPNNGMPEVIDGVTKYTMTPDTFADYGLKLVECGIKAIGGCCGTTPKHIAALARKVRTVKIEIEESDKAKTKSVISSESEICELDVDGRFLVIGERINPTGKKKLQEQLRQGSMDLVVEMAESQTSYGADILDINMGTNGIDELSMMQKAIYSVIGVTNRPLCIDSSHIDVIEQALRIYPGRALINSISYEERKCRPLMKIAAKYGAMVILLPLSDAGLPKNLEEKIDIINKLLEVAKEEGVPRDSIVIDGLVTTVGANKNAAIETLETIDYCKNVLHLPTVCGLSNISFGLPERININTAFLTMAISKGLTMAICNPSQAQLMNAALASDLLIAKDNSDNRYVENVVAVENVATTSNESKNKIEGSKVFVDVVKGLSDTIISDVCIELDAGKSPKDIIDNDLIPGVNKVGELFEQKKYFLPQLIAGANAMDKAIDYLTPMLGSEDNKEKKGTVVIATVEGDIHDIGKNLVVLMLKNYGYEVIDLGKDVKCDEIIKAAKEYNADIIGLSALMTTTMMRMKEVVVAVKDNNLKCKVVIGGAVVSSDFAKEINADGYSKDANEAVKVIDRLLTD